MTGRRYPYTNIAPHLAHLTARQTGDLVGVTRAVAQGWRYRKGNITEIQADILATYLGIHPSTIWAEWQTELERSCDQCGSAYVPRRHNQRFCSAECKRANDRVTYAPNRARWKRERYRTDPEFRARCIAEAAVYAAEHPEYRAIQQRQVRARAKQRAAQDDEARRHPRERRLQEPAEGARNATFADRTGVPRETGRVELSHPSVIIPNSTPDLEESAA